MHLGRFLRLGLLAFCVAFASPLFAAPGETTLRAILACLATGPWKVSGYAKWPADKHSRTVDTAEGERLVSVKEGYRLLLEPAEGMAFVNFKVERSAPELAAADREVIGAQMQHVVSKAIGPDGTPLTVRHDRMGDAELLHLHQPGLQRGGPMSMYSVFVPGEDVVVTLYVLNRTSKNQAFETFEAYERGRDAVLAPVLMCVLEARTSMPAASGVRP